MLTVNRVQPRTQRCEVVGGGLVAGVAEAARAAAQQRTQASAARHRAGVERAATASANAERLACSNRDVAAAAIEEGRTIGCGLALACIQHQGVDRGAGGADVFADNQVTTQGLDAHRTAGGDARWIHAAHSQAVGIHIAQATDGGIGRACSNHRHIVGGVRQRETATAQETQAIGRDLTIGALCHLTGGGQHDTVIGHSGIARGREGCIECEVITEQRNRALDRGCCGNGDVAAVAGLAQGQTRQISDVADGHVGEPLRAHQVRARHRPRPVKIAGKASAARLNGEHPSGVQRDWPVGDEFELVGAQGNARARTSRDGGRCRG